MSHLYSSQCPGISLVVQPIKAVYHNLEKYLYTVYIIFLSLCRKCKSCASTLTLKAQGCYIDISLDGFLGVLSGQIIAWILEAPQIYKLLCLESGAQLCVLLLLKFQCRWLFSHRFYVLFVMWFTTSYTNGFPSAFVESPSNFTCIFHGGPCNFM